MTAPALPARGEEIANSVSHGIGFVAVLAGLPVLLDQAAGRGTAALAGAIVFAGTAAMVYLSSTLFHAVRRPRAREILRRIDHSAIYLLIAGTYTPFTLGALRGALGWTVFGLIWTLATAGVVFKAVRGFGHPRLSLALYLVMGWLVLAIAKPLWVLVPPGASSGSPPAGWPIPPGSASTRPGGCAMATSSGTSSCCSARHATTSR